MATQRRRLFVGFCQAGNLQKVQDGLQPHVWQAQTTKPLRKRISTKVQVRMSIYIYIYIYIRIYTVFVYIYIHTYLHIFRLKTWSSNDFRFCHLILYPSGSVRQGGLGWDWVHLLTECKFKQDLVEEGRVRFPKSVRWCLPSINICLVKPRTDPVKSSLHVCKGGLECRPARSQMLHVQVFTDIYISCLG